MAFHLLATVSLSNSVSTGWEDPAVLGYFGTYGNVGEVVYNTTEFHTGTRSLTMTESPYGGTPQG